MKQVADGSRSGQRVWRKILPDEVSCVKSCTIKASKQGQHEKVVSPFDNESTLLAVREYISISGQSKFLNCFNVCN